MRYLRALLRYAPPPSWVLAWVAVSYLGLVVVQDMSSRRPGFSTFSWLIIIVLAGIVLLLLNSRSAREGQLEKLPLNSVSDLVALHAVARGKLDGIQFQQRHTTGWSGNLTSGLGLSGSRSSSLERTRQAMSYPELVRDFRDFLTTTVRIMESIPTAAEMTPVAIIIDELDKVQIPDQAQEFVNEVKALFGIDVPGCIFLISVSDEALASFERRGLPLRAAFESTFDIIFRVEPLELSDTRAVLCNRVVGLSEPFVCLCHSFSGGLPRETIRRARGIVGCGKKTLAEVANRLVSEDMNIKEAALRTLISQRLEAEPYSSKLIQYLDGYRSSEVGVLLASLQNPPIKKIDLLGQGSAILDVFQLQLEAFAYRYFCATVLTVFNNDMTQQSLERGLGQDEPSNFNRLADARRLLEINSRVAWLTVTSFRRPWQLEVIEVPW